MNDFQPTDIHPIGPDYWRSLAVRQQAIKEADKAHALPAMDADDDDSDCSSQPSPLAWHISDLTLAVGLVGFIAYVVLAA